ncbi:hypothetical protein BH24ACT22_BH24ACT22_00880 [soil metagenome]
MIDFLGRVFAPLTDLMSSVLELFHSLGAPWWLSIVFLTVLVRGVLFPLTIRQVKNMRKMQELRPDMDKIRARYKKDRQQQQEALIKLYQERKVNPAAGFFPILIQMPVFITMYHVIRDHEESLRSFASGGILWFTNLSEADPYFILPVLSAMILIGAGEMSSKNVSPGQKRMMRLMPLTFTVFIARFPAGLFVYWITSNTFTLVQNFLIYRRLGQTPQQPETEPVKASETPTSSKAKEHTKRRRRKKKKR